MSAEEIDADFDEGEIEESPAEFAAARKELEERCHASKISLEEHDDPFGGSYLSLALPAGREKRRVNLYGINDIKSVLSIPFEDYVFLGDYSAVCSYKEGKIEAAIRPLRPGPSSYILRRLLGRQIDSDVREDETIVEFKGKPEDRIERILIGRSSDVLIALSSPRVRDVTPSLRIHGLQIAQHDQAVNLLERIANTAFFQIDLASDLPLGLIRERRTPVRPVPKPGPIELQFPQTEYDEAPMSLYWYARSATGMPLLQFLAYYQSIEFYFPIYSQAEARRKIRNILKDPSFRSDRDADIGRILSAIKGIGGYGFGDERSQLRAAMHECLDPNALREFLMLTKERVEFFSSRTKSLTDIKIPINNPTADLRNDVAERIYDIRCKIVHTKAGSNEGEVELLLPFSKGAELLYFDIELIQYVAQQTLISASSPLHF